MLGGGGDDDNARSGDGGGDDDDDDDGGAIICRRGARCLGLMAHRFAGGDGGEKAEEPSEPTNALCENELVDSTKTLRGGGGGGDGDETNTRGGAEAGGSHLDAGTARLMLLLFCKVVR